MSHRVLNVCWQGLRYGAAGVLRLVRWTLWLALGLLLGVQVWIAASEELAVPRFVLRLFEERLAASALRVKFGHARFDPSGRILLEDVRLSLPAFNEPIAAAPAAYLELEPWALLAGRFELHRVHLSGARFTVAAMLSRSGRPEDFVRDLDTTLRLEDHEVVVEQLTARVGGIAVAVHGGFHLLPRAGVSSAPSLSESIAAHYPDICRQLIRVADRLADLDQPSLNVELTPSDTRGAIATVEVTARSLALAAPFPVAAHGLHLTTRFPLQGETPVMAPITLALDDLTVGPGVALTAVRAHLRGVLQPALYTYDPREMQLSAARAAARGFALTDLSARLDAGPLPLLKAELVASCDGQPIAVHGTADLARQTAALDFRGALAPTLLAPIGRAIQHDLRAYIGFGAPVQLAARVTLDPGWKFARLSGRVYARQVDAYHVFIDEGGGDIELEPTHFIARHAYARLGSDFARGSFEQDFTDLRFRFLLEGRIRPLDISGWFGHWWPAFFSDFAFPVAPLDASVDVAGWWKQGHRTTVFVYADSMAPVIRGTPLDHVRTRLFIRPNFFDGLELFATSGPGAVRGTFMRQIDPATYALLGMDLDVDSTLSLDLPAKIFGSAVGDTLAAFKFSEPPAVHLRGRFDGPAAPHGVHQKLDLEGLSTGSFTYFGFPLSNLAFKAAVRDDEVTLRDIRVGFAGGVVTGQARLWGPAPERRLGFDLELRDGSLGQASRVLEEFSAARRGEPPPAPGKFVQDKANVKLSLAASAEGLFTDPFSYRGEGHANLEGPALGEVRMLGLLSELLSFTSLRFTAARANFTLAGNHLDFSDVTATGANSGINARGRYDLRSHELDFKARVNPFQESKFLPSVVIGAVLMPFSSVLEVKLTGSLDKPAWAFVNGPTNFIRNLTRPNAPATSAAPSSPPATTPAAPPPPPDYLHR